MELYGKCLLGGLWDIYLEPQGFKESSLKTTDQDLNSQIKNQTIPNAYFPLKLLSVKNEPLKDSKQKNDMF